MFTNLHTYVSLIFNAKISSGSGEEVDFDNFAILVTAASLDI